MIKTINCDKNIIKFLKENKKNGKPFCFLPHGVRRWIFENCKNPLLMTFNFSRDTLKWEFIDTFLFNPLCEADINIDVLFALPDDYEKLLTKLQQPKKEESIENENTAIEGYWKDFEIDEYGCFAINTSLFHWSEWSRALWQPFKGGRFIAKAFGGWYYKGKGWYMLPMVSVDVGKPEDYCATAYASGEKIKPLIPQKIRFYFKDTWGNKNV